MKIDLNDLAAEVCKMEGGKEQVNIAQVKDVLNALGQVLARYRWWAAVAIVTKLRRRAIDAEKIKSFHSH